MNKLFICVLILLLQFRVINYVAQTSQLDSLKINLINTNDDTNKVNTLNTIAIELISNDMNDSALNYALASLNVSQKINFKIGQAQAHNILANIYFYQGNYYESLKNNLASLKIKEKLGDKKGIANSYNNIGNDYSRLNNLSGALESHFEALKIRKSLNDKINIGFSYNNIGFVYYKQGNYPKALTYHLEALKIKKEFSDKEDISTSLNNVGTVYNDLGNYKEALKFQYEALKMKQEIDDKEGIEITYSSLCTTHFNLKDYKTAEEFGLKALNLATEIEDIETLVDVNLQLSKIYKVTKKFEKSLAYYTDYINVRDSLFNIENAKKTLQLQLESEFDKRSLSNKLEQEKKEEVTKFESKKQKTIIILMSSILILTLFFAGLIYKYYLRNKKNNAIISKQKLDVEIQRKTIEENNKDLKDSIRYAERIQQATLPSIEIIKEQIPDSFIFYKPKDILSGDFYWVSDAVTKYEEKFSMVAVADCTGHGVPGALMSIIGNNYLRLCEREPSVNRPSEALDFINIGISRTLRQEYSKSSIQDGMDMVFVAIDYAKSVVHFSGAKNSIYIVRNGQLEEYKGDRHPIGAFVGEEMKKFTNHTIPIEKGDCMYLFSDGYVDQIGGIKGKKFMYNRFKDLIVSNSHLSMEEQQKNIIKTFEEWKGYNEQVDDICVLGIRI